MQNWSLLLAITSLILISPIIANEDISYSCSQKVSVDTSGQNDPIQSRFGRQSHWAIPLNINVMLSTQPRKESSQSGVFHHPREKQCNKKILFLPVLPLDLKFPIVEVLPDQQLCLNGRLLLRKCMPQNPVAFPLMMEGHFGSLIVSSSYYSSK